MESEIIQTAIISCIMILVGLVSGFVLLKVQGD